MAAYHRVDTYSHRWVDCTPRSAPDPTLSNEYGKSLLFLYLFKIIIIIILNWRILTKDHFACCATVEDWIIAFAAYAVGETPNAVSVGWTGPKIVASRGGSSWFLVPTWVSPHTASWSVQHSTSVWPLYVRLWQ